MKKIQLYLLLSALFISCDNNKIEVNCNILEKNGISYILNGEVFTGNCTIMTDNIITERRNIKNGLHTNTTGYYPVSGELKFTGGMRNDSIHGKYREYYETGKVAIKGQFKKGFYDGKWRFLREDGELIRITIFKDGRIISETDQY